MEKSNEEQLRIVLKNFDAVKAQKDALEKENAALKKELAQQKVLYKNMLNRFSGVHFEDWERKYKQLNERHAEKMKKLSQALDENNKMKNTIDSVRGAICNAHNRLDRLCQTIGVEYHVKEIPNQEETLAFRGEHQPLEKNEKPLVTRNEFQNQQFIKYVRTMVDIYEKTGELTGIAKVAGNFQVSTMTKVQFFKYRLDEKPLTDERIIEVYKEIKKK